MKTPIQIIVLSIAIAAGILWFSAYGPSPARAAEGAGPPPTYKVVRLSDYGPSIQMNAAAAQRDETQLNTLAAQGWRVVSCFGSNVILAK